MDVAVREQAVAVPGLAREVEVHAVPSREVGIALHAGGGRGGHGWLGFVATLLLLVVTFLVPALLIPALLIPALLILAAILLIAAIIVLFTLFTMLPLPVTIVILLVLVVVAWADVLVIIRGVAVAANTADEEGARSTRNTRR